MKRATWSIVTKHVIVMLCASALLAGCPSQFEPPRPGTRMPSGAEVLDAAQNFYVAGPERPPKDTTDFSLPPGHSIAENDAPRMTIATMTASAGPTPPSVKILARITSTGDYAPMGIRQGRNIVWRDAENRAWLTPQNGSPRQLSSVPGWVFPIQPGHEPSLYRVRTNSFSFVVCLDDCGSGHCGMF
jgi:hypothetical protein